MTNHNKIKYNKNMCVIHGTYSIFTKLLPHFLLFVRNSSNLSSDKVAVFYNITTASSAVCTRQHITHSGDVGCWVIPWFLMYNTAPAFSWNINQWLHSSASIRTSSNAIWQFLIICIGSTNASFDFFLHKLWIQYTYLTSYVGLLLYMRGHL